MKPEDIHELLAKGVFPDCPVIPEFIETHISWVFLTPERVYKIKKPVRYTFLDFSTLEKRRYFCEREVVLNRRLTRDIYLGVVPVRLDAGRWLVDGDAGAIEDYAVCMRRMDAGRRMDVLLRQVAVTGAEIMRLADVIAGFHLDAPVIPHQEGPGIRELFNDLGGVADLLEARRPGWGKFIKNAVAVSDEFLHANAELMRARMRAGFYRDGHGDLHARNIFLLDRPQVFDCIEFNDAFRRTDVLSDVAFLCMDLDAVGRRDLSALFFDRWNSSFAGASADADARLFVYYKAYRANIRAKVNCLRARSAIKDAERESVLAAATAYLSLMQQYLGQLTDRR